MSTHCLICNEKCGFFKGQVILFEGSICEECWKKAVMGDGLTVTWETKKYTVAQIKAAIRRRGFVDPGSIVCKPTKMSGGIEFDDKHRTFRVQTDIFLGKQSVISYDQLIGYDLLENNLSITKGGFGSALVGGALFGSIGAIVGSVAGKRKNEQICQSLTLKITVKGHPTDSVYIPYISSKVRHGGIVYQQAYRQAQDAISSLQLIINDMSKAPVAAEAYVSSADEIRRFKALLDDGIITEAEYSDVKNRLLKNRSSK